ncbi:L-type lectin-domain containing receptor kinase IX.1 [Dichanthelium oligosanthes]|uniref:non-specific serine/threonine protein kinase n=1 Tax=Dichanthelium oligosanthes TaxID=888268 RepID=A0A1E5VTH1_9POAL|nr:L-type lectin-domain containing receptor kinase IX.1 [Dichanthelium oligosanthes]
MAYPGAPLLLLLLLATACLCFISPPHTAAVSFSYDFSKASDQDKLWYASSSRAGDRINLTKMTPNAIGRVAYSNPVPLWDDRTGKRASFNTSFSFAISGNPGPTPTQARGDGMAFFVGPYPPGLPPDSDGAYLGLFSNQKAQPLQPATVGVEFDTYWNQGLDPWDITTDHIGIDVGSINSKSYTKDLANGSLSGTMAANITYDAGSRLMVVTLRLGNGSTLGVQAIVDFLDAGVPQDAAVGFSAATGGQVESHQLLSWSFSSTDLTRSKFPLWAKMLLSVAITLLAVLVAALLIIMRRKRSPPLQGVREFSYNELSAATNNFSDDRKLGAGSFGEVYRGRLPYPSKLLVAVKRLKMTQPSLEQIRLIRRDFLTEITILPQLSHRNLVKLVGWCGGGDSDKLLLVYELVTNKSLDEHLHGSERLLTWPERYSIVLGIGSAIEYLHNGHPNHILHRDIKPSNVMLNDAFEAKLGDFGLVRQVDRGQTSLGGTRMIGTWEYIDPVCISRDTVSTESDVYSFGVLLLEIAAGVKPTKVQGTGGHLSNTLVKAVQEKYGMRASAILEMADARLNGDFDRSQMERVLRVGLLCVQQDRENRPEIRDAIFWLRNLTHPVPNVGRLDRALLSRCLSAPSSVAAASSTISSSHSLLGASISAAAATSAAGGTTTRSDTLADRRASRVASAARRAMSAAASGVPSRFIGKVAYTPPSSSSSSAGSAAPWMEFA